MIRSTLFTLVVSSFAYGQQSVAHLTNEDSKLYINDVLIGKGKDVSIDWEVKTNGLIYTFGVNSQYYYLHSVKVVTPGYVDQYYSLPGDSKKKTFLEEYTFPNTRKLINRDPNSTDNYFKYDVGYGFSALGKLKIYEIDEKEDFSNLERLTTQLISEGVVSKKIKPNGINYQFSSKKDERKVSDFMFSGELNTLLSEQGLYDTTGQVLNSNYRNVVLLESNMISIDQFVNKSHKNGFTCYRMEVMWKVKNLYGEAIDSMNITTIVEKFSPNWRFTFQDVIVQGLKESLHSFETTELFKKYMTTPFVNNETEKTISLMNASSVVKNLDDADDAAVIIFNNENVFASGFAVSNDGMILTNFHSICTDNGYTGVKVQLANGDKLDAEVLSIDRVNDVVLLKTNHTFEKCFNIRSNVEASKALKVYTIGVSKTIDLGKTVITGVISNNVMINKVDPAIQLNMSLNTESSGGPVFDENGNLLGIISGKLYGEAVEGIGFASPSSVLIESLGIIK